jgi:peptidoglycan/xylan/chitin deacetylase (PgdA/CDA1 family)
VKRLVSSLLVALGRLAPGRGIPVLLYHSVDSSGSVISVTPSVFRSQMAFLRAAGYRTATLAELVASLSAPPRKDDRAVVLTFDDGFLNNYTEAFPVLREHGFTATIFLATDYLGSACAWERHPSIPGMPLMDWAQVREMHEAGIDFQAHTCSHPHMTRLDRAAQVRELSVSKALIEQRLGKRVDYFCHPYGDTDDSTQAAVRDCGYAAAFGRLDFGVRNRGRSLYDLTRVGTGRFRSHEDLQAGLLGTYRHYIALRKLVSRERDPMLQ